MLDNSLTIRTYSQLHPNEHFDHHCGSTSNKRASFEELYNVLWFYHRYTKKKETFRHRDLQFNLIDGMSVKFHKCRFFVWSQIFIFRLQLSGGLPCTMYNKQHTLNDNVLDLVSHFYRSFIFAMQSKKCKREFSIKMWKRKTSDIAWITPRCTEHIKCEVLGDCFVRNFFFVRISMISVIAIKESKSSCRTIYKYILWIGFYKKNEITLSQTSNTNGNNSVRLQSKICISRSQQNQSVNYFVTCEK